MEVTEEALTQAFSVMLPHLDERQRRVVTGALARAFGRGGVAAVARTSEMSRSTVQTAAGEIDAGIEPSARVRRPGGGRKKAIDKEPDLLLELDDLVSPETRGDPMSPLRWTLKSTRELAEALGAKGFEISASLVGQLLHKMGYSLQGTAKQREGAQHPDRNAQFEYLNARAGEFLAAGQPVISVDTKKKELVGDYANGGKEWQPAGTPTRVDVHDFPDPEMPKAVPYGVYDIGADEGWVSVGDDGDTARFAVESIRRWWSRMGKARYPEATRLLITADAGGSNGYRVRAWKTELARFAEESGLEVTVCHYPPGTSKWNRIEHRLFSFVTMNWRGQPLSTYRVIVELIAATTTRKGLTVQADLDPGHYPRGVTVTDKELAAVPLTGHDWHGEWNYTVRASKTK